MDIRDRLSSASHKPILTIDMHTTGEPTRIIIQGAPELTGTLLEQRSQAQREYDHIRRRLVFEPRGHFDMYGAILRKETELTQSGAAHIGVLFMTNDGYSTMCGHATIALGRFLLDTSDTETFPLRNSIKHDPRTNTAQLLLHAPCGLLDVSVPTTPDGLKSDPTRPVSFISTPSFATAINISFPIPPNLSWPELNNQQSITASIAYGGAFYCIVPVTTLGFSSLTSIDFPAMNLATHNLKAAITTNPTLTHLITHPDSSDLSFLYGVIVTETSPGDPSSETGLCYFADQEIDRSPTGSGVAARAALAYAQGQLATNQSRTYHSLVSNASKDRKGGFVGTVISQEAEKINNYPVVRVKVEGYAFYTGVHSFVVEEEDPLGEDGFVFEKL